MKRVQHYIIGHLSLTLKELDCDQMDELDAWVELISQGESLAFMSAEVMQTQEGVAKMLATMATNDVCENEILDELRKNPEMLERANEKILILLRVDELMVTMANSKTDYRERQTERELFEDLRSSRAGLDQCLTNFHGWHPRELGKLTLNEKIEIVTALSEDSGSRTQTLTWTAEAQKWRRKRAT